MRCHPFTGGLESDCGQAKRGTEERGEASPQAVSDEPDIGLGEEKTQVTDEFLGCRRLDMLGEEAVWTHHTRRVKEAIFDQCSGDTRVIAPSVENGPVEAVAYRRKDPGEVDVGTTAGKQEVVVQFVLFGRGAL